MQKHAARESTPKCTATASVATAAISPLRIKTASPPPMPLSRALKDAGINPSDVGYINAHGTSTTLGDQAETTAVKTVFKEHARRLSISSTKEPTRPSPGRQRRRGTDFLHPCLARRSDSAHHQPGKSRPALRPGLQRPIAPVAGYLHRHVQQLRLRRRNGSLVSASCATGKSL